MKLLIDAGNTRLKWARWDGARLLAGGAVAHADTDQDYSALWKGIENVDAVWVASVTGADREADLTRGLRAAFDCTPRFVHSVAQACGVRNAYPRPQDLGVDRFLGLIAAHARAHAATVIAGCGTALVLDALGADGAHCGGLIAASPELAQAALRGGTARLGAAPPGTLKELADNTADAIESGTWLAAAALVERFCAQAAARTGVAPQLLLTGGGAQRLGGLLTLRHRIDADLVLHGLAHYAEWAR
jgi:type III pantothenate kinase